MVESLQRICILTMKRRSKRKAHVTHTEFSLGLKLYVGILQNPFLYNTKKEVCLVFSLITTFTIYYLCYLHTECLYCIAGIKVCEISEQKNNSSHRNSSAEVALKRSFMEFGDLFSVFCSLQKRQEVSKIRAEGAGENMGKNYDNLLEVCPTRVSKSYYVYAIQFDTPSISGSLKINPILCNLHWSPLRNIRSLISDKSFSGEISS